MVSGELLIGLNSGWNSDTDIVAGYIDALSNAGFKEVRTSLRFYNDDATIAKSKINALYALSKGMRVVWGISASSLTAANWADYEAAVLEQAAWAEANGITEFQIGNELELINDDTTLTDAQLRTNLKALATAVQAIYTRGYVSYSFSGNSLASWISIGNGDIDIMALNLYRGGVTFNNDWKTYATNLYNAFGNNCYLTEFSISYTSLDSYSTSETTQADALYEMIQYIKDVGIKRALFYAYPSDEYGALKTNGNYRALWDILIKNSGTFTGSAGSSMIRGVSNGEYNR